MEEKLRRNLINAVWELLYIRQNELNEKIYHNDGISFEEETIRNIEIDNLIDMINELENIKTGGT